MDVSGRQLDRVEPRWRMKAADKGIRPGSRTLREGAFGGDVAWLQDRLGLTPTGWYWPGTVRRVRAYQEEHGLAVTGVSGLAVWICMGVAKPWGFPLALGEHFGPGDCDRCVIPADRGYEKSCGWIRRTVGVGESGVYDRVTETAVSRWQRARGLEPTGRVDVETWVRMKS